ncbi:MAG: hypothetical protein ACJ8DV_24805, partial [Microvirga sp.]
AKLPSWRAEPGENADHACCRAVPPALSKANAAEAGTGGGGLVNTAIPSLGSITRETMRLPSDSTVERMDEDFSAAGALSRIKTAEGGGPSARP